MTALRRPGLYGVGVGPGDPRWLTLRAAEVLRAADVVALPRGERASSSRAFAIVESYLDFERQELLDLPFSTAPEVDAVASREAIYEAVAPKLAAGLAVALPVLGDPLLYGSFIYLYERVKARLGHVYTEIVPGVSAFAGAAARAGRALARGDERVAILPAVYEHDLDELRLTLTHFDTTILLKVHRGLDRVLDLIDELGLSADSWYAERVGTPDERVLHDVGALRDRAEEPPYLSLLVARRHPRAGTRSEQS